MGTRKPIVAGMFYEAEFNSLNKQINQCFLSEKGPGSLPVKRGQKEIAGVIVPHAGYVYSGPCAAWAYKEIAEARMADIYIVIGPNHTGLGEDSVSLQNWETPLGAIRTHVDFARDIMAETGLKDDPSAHEREHSIEVQLPFLQFASKDRMEKLKIVAISLKSADKLSEISEALKKISRQRNQKICIIISSDFTHFGPNFDHVPFRYNVKDNIYRIDHEAIEYIKNLDAKGFMHYVRNNQMTICGFLPIVLGLEYFSSEVKKARVLQYYTSGDLLDDYTNSVSYASLFFG